jgi:hypothetical protein
MKRTWDEQELVEHWTLFEPEAALLANRTGTGKLAAAVLLKFFQFSGRFPRYHRDVPAPVLDFLAKQLGIEPAVWFDYDLKGRSSKRDREQVRTFLGFRPITLDDEEPLHRWLEHEVVPKDTDERHLRAALLDWCRAHRLEPPTDSSADRIIASAVHAFEDRLFAQIHDQLSATTPRCAGRVGRGDRAERRSVLGVLGIPSPQVRSRPHRPSQRRARDRKTRLDR